MTTGPDRSAERRAFIRAHHPDRGGDPAHFRAGLARFASPPPDGAGPAGVRLVGRRAWWRRVAALRPGRRRPPRVR